MDIFIVIVKLIIGFGIYNVWLLRFNKSTAWRGGSATNMKEEFAQYGLSEPMMKLVGFLKLTFATLLILSIWFSVLSMIAALGMTILMLGAIVMHLKVKDPFKKSMPALALLLLCLLVGGISYF